MTRMYVFKTCYECPHLESDFKKEWTCVVCEDRELSDNEITSLNKPEWCPLMNTKVYALESVHMEGIESQELFFNKESAEKRLEEIKEKHRKAYNKKEYSDFESEDEYVEFWCENYYIREIKIKE